MNKPLSIAIGAIIKDNQILLIKRVKEPYAGKWSLPGGKIEHGEHISEAILREIKEETGLDASFVNHAGIVSEHFLEESQLANHFLLHVCEVTPLHDNLQESDEGKLRWFDIVALEQHKTSITPSDYEMIEKLIQTKGKNYYECVIDKVSGEYLLKQFE